MNINNQSSRLLTCDDIDTKGIVTSPKTFIKDSPDPAGIFSTIIFGNTKEERSKNFGKIILPVRIFHPVVFEYLYNRYKQIQGIVSQKP
ncbi:MAG: hypothetical protein ACP5G1_04035, partial [Nanopusillaceae archaeon]